MSRKLMNTSDGTGRTLLDQKGKILTESEYRKLYENQQIEGQTLPEVDVYAYNSAQANKLEQDRLRVIELQEIDDRINRETEANIKEEIRRSNSSSFWDMKVSGTKSTIGNRIDKIKEIGESRKEWEGRSLIDKALVIGKELAWGIIPELPILNMFRSVNKGYKVYGKVNENKIAAHLSPKFFQKSKDIYKKIDEVLPVDLTKGSRRYRELVRDPRNVEKYKQLDLLEGNKDAMLSLDNFIKEKYKYDNFDLSSIHDAKYNIKGLSKFNISKYETEQLVDEYILNNVNSAEDVFKMKNAINKGGYKEELADYFNSGALKRLRDNNPYGRLTIFNNKNNNIYNTVSHEMKHNVNGGGVYMGPKYKEMVKSIFIDRKKLDESSLELYDYYTDPSEFSSYIGTNLKDELVDKGLLKSVHDIVTTDMIKSIEGKSEILDMYIPVIKDRDKLIKLINITPYAIGAGIIASPTLETPVKK